MSVHYSREFLAYNTTAELSCLPGFVLNGTTVRRCDMNGVWTGTQPTCEGKKLWADVAFVIL